MYTHRDLKLPIIHAFLQSQSAKSKTRTKLGMLATLSQKHSGTTETHPLKNFLYLDPFTPALTVESQSELLTGIHTLQGFSQKKIPRPN